MNCNRCGNPVEANSTFCKTCGNQILTTVVPQNINQPTVFPQTTNTVVPKNDNSTILAIVLVLVIFIGAGLAGIMVLKQTKSVPQVSDGKQNIAVLDDTTTKMASTTTKNNWKTSQRVDVIDETSFYQVKGFNIVIPEGYKPSYSNNMLTVVDSTETRYFVVDIVDSNVNYIDINQYQQTLASKGYVTKNYTRVNIAGSDAIRFDMELESKHIDAFLVQASSTKVAVFMFVNETDMNYMNNMIAISIGK